MYVYIYIYTYTYTYAMNLHGLPSTWNTMAHRGRRGNEDRRWSALSINTHIHAHAPLGLSRSRSYSTPAPVTTKIFGEPSHSNRQKASTSLAICVFESKIRILAGNWLHKSEFAFFTSGPRWYRSWLVPMPHTRVATGLLSAENGQTERGGRGCEVWGKQQGCPSRFSEQSIPLLPPPKHDLLPAVKALGVAGGGSQLCEHLMGRSYCKVCTH